MRGAFPPYGNEIARMSKAIGTGYRGRTIPSGNVGGRAMEMTPITGASAWIGRNVQPEEYRVELSVACHDEIRSTVDELRAFPLPTIVLRPEDFAMPACREAMVRVRRILDQGVRFAIVDRLPVTEMDTGEATAIYWLLSSMI